MIFRLELIRNCEHCSLYIPSPCSLFTSTLLSGMMSGSDYLPSAHSGLTHLFTRTRLEMLLFHTAI